MRARRVSFAAVVALAVGGVVGACTDGVTPDCSDAAAQCGPNGVGEGGDEDVTSISTPDGAGAGEAGDGGGEAEAGDTE
jgi:hypothetical protein